MNASLWWVICGVGVVLLRVGLAIHAAGSVRAKNAAGIVMRGVADMCLGVLAFWAVGGWIAGVERGSGLFFFLLCATLIASGIVVGVVGERSRFFAMCSLPVLVCGVVAPLAWRLAWGWLGKIGYHDVAGASMVHLTGALCALVSAVMVGPRTGKYNRDGSSNAIPGHNMPLGSVGVLVMFVAWLPYVAGFATDVAMAAGNVLLAGAAGAVVAMVVSQVKYMKPDIHLTYVGLLSGLVAISAAADVRAGWMAVIIGAVAGLVVPLAAVWMDLVVRVDDLTAGIAVHGIGAVWGVIAAGLFTHVESVGARFRLLGVQVLGLAVIGAMAVGLSLGALWVLKRTVGLRSKEADEYDGLDLAEHDIGAYPDFQQTMIKSYHLREV